MFSSWQLILSSVLDPSPVAPVLLFLVFGAVLNMPSVLSSSPFLTLKPDHDCGRASEHKQDVPAKSTSNKPFASLNGTLVNGSPTTGYTNGHTNGYTSGTSTQQPNSPTIGLANGHSHATKEHEDDFIRLEKPQQDLLLLHGPRQKYSLERAKDIPELREDHEILIQVLAIGLNPVDWKGADYGFSQPSYPWVNGRDFAGIVVKAPRKPSRIQQGDVVFGPSTDYRDLRKAAYQEYVVTTDCNVARVPQGTSVKEGAALGVAFVAAIMAVGISFGIDFSSPRTSPRGPDFLSVVRGLKRSEVPEDIRDECFEGIDISERPQPGEWLAIWGASSTTGIMALQLAKLAGLKVACIADLAKGGSRLSDLGADFMVDRYDTKRAIEIVRGVTGGKLRFAIDTTGKETAALAEQTLQQSASGPKSHLLGLTGLPKKAATGVVHHTIPIKIFHESPEVGESIMQWLEELLLAKSLKLPEVDIADGGLAGINAALDRLRSGTVSGKRIVVPVGTSTTGAPKPKEPETDKYGVNGTGETSEHLRYAEDLNSDPERIMFAYWVPNVSGGLVISKIPQRTKWDLKSNVKYARTAERWGFEYALSQIRFMAGYGADNQHEPVTFSQALLMSTEKIKLIAALLPGPWNPAVAAKQIASIDNYTDGRIAVNVVSGWFKAEVSVLQRRVSFRN